MLSLAQKAARGATVTLEPFDFAQDRLREGSASVYMQA